jgi:GH24 family phage-related lysozyme (muramidase)
MSKYEEYRKVVERMARVIDPDCWNYGDLPSVKTEMAFAEARGRAYTKAREILDGMGATGIALVPREANEAVQDALLSVSFSDGTYINTSERWRRAIAAGEIKGGE